MNRNSFLIIVGLVLIAANLYRSLTSCKASTSLPMPSEPMQVESPIVAPLPEVSSGNETEAPVQQLIVLFGLENSGVKFVASVLAQALGATLEEGREFSTPDGLIRLLALPLPLTETDQQCPLSSKLPLVPNYRPARCNDGVSFADDCTYLSTEKHERYLVNITSHIDIYRQQGVQVLALMVARDPALHFRGLIQRSNCASKDQNALYEEFVQGRALLQTTMDALSLPSSTTGISFGVMSYETLMTLKQAYLIHFFETMLPENLYNQLLRDKNGDFVRPELKDANMAHLGNQVIPPEMAAKWKSDEGVPRYWTPKNPPNMYEAKSYKELQKNKKW